MMYWPPIEVEEVIKGSRFITRFARVDTVEKAKAFLGSLREQEPTATHHCWAYIVGDPHSTTLLGCSDDGEPAGTAGKPMLNVLQHSGIGDIIAVCTRFYGGTKLGTGGLARAYGGGVKLAMESVRTEKKINTELLNITAGYDCVKDLEHLFGQYSSIIDNTDYGEQVSFSITVPAEFKQELTEHIHIRFGDKVQWKSIQ